MDGNAGCHDWLHVHDLPQEKCAALHEKGETNNYISCQEFNARHLHRPPERGDLEARRMVKRLRRESRGWEGFESMKQDREWFTENVALWAMGGELSRSRLIGEILGDIKGHRNAL